MLIKIQNMVQAGCRFGPGDLTMDLWGELAELGSAQNELIKPGGDD